MSISGYLALGIATSGFFVESTSSGYVRQAFSFRDSIRGQIGGYPSGLVTFSTSSAATSISAYAFYNTITGGVPLLVYPLAQPKQFGVFNPITVNPNDVAFSTADYMSNEGMSVTPTGIVANSGLPSIGQPGLRNALINGSMDFWQRGTSTTTFGYCADRWTYGAAGGTVTVARQAVTEASVLDAGLTYWARLTTAGTTSIQLAQKIEGVRTFAGSTVTLSFYAKCGSGTVALGYLLSQQFGTGGSPSSNVDTFAPNITLTTTPQRFTTQITLPSIAGKTKGTNGDDVLAWVFNFPGSIALDISLTGMQLELGGTATPFERRPEEVEFALCQRYYQTGQVWFGASASAASQSIGYIATFVATMRTTPTIALTTPSVTGATGLASSNVGAASFIVSALSSGANYVTFSSPFTASAEL
jgi:hypothetical protein